MDPNACLRRFLDALNERDHREAREAHNDLLIWLRRGGFEPDWTPEERARFEYYGL